ncbi:MAG: formylmethanofuran dehydrogenase subunit C [Gammaproteobacteria bacterium]|nr:formylmethanofuran dehydrogenase subunit C [Gammaproteobacteria bacterium]
MSALTLALRQPPPGRVDLSAIRPDRLAGLGAAAIERLALPCGRSPVALGELFRVHPGDPAELRILGGDARLDGVAAGLAGGRVLVEGEVGWYAGEGLRGGVLEIHGDSGPFTGSAMSGGEIHVHGDAGERLGAPRAGGRRGMAGGVLHVRGSAGARAGERMRRGLLLVDGDAGDCCAARIIAGTVAVLGRAGAQTGVGMRRGTLLLGTAAEGLPPTFNATGAWRPGFLELLVPVLARRQPAWTERLGGDPLQRWVGDLATDGRGEIFAPD